MNINYYRELKKTNKMSSNPSTIVKLLSLVILVTFITCGCSLMKNKEDETTDLEPAQETEAPVAEETHPAVDVAAEDDGIMVTYNPIDIGRNDPFMPAGEIAMYNKAKADAIKEANAHNSAVARLKQMKNKTIREPDDISPYSFNLPVPPTSLASAEAAAAKIVRTKVVGIMYNKSNPSALINVDNKDYLVREGDKIIGQEYRVMKINPAVITVSLGSNIYSAGIGELFSKDEFRKSQSQNDIYNIRNRFGGRKG